MALEEELQLDLGPALDAIRGDLTRALEDVPSTFRSVFDDQLQGVVSDFGAAAELAREELDRVFATPVDVATIDVPVEVDTSEIDAAAAAIDDVGTTVEVPVDVDASEVSAAADEVEALDGQTVEVAVAVDTSQVDSAADDIAGLGAAASVASGQAAGLGEGLGVAAVAGGKLSSSLEHLGGAGVVIPTSLAAGIGLFAGEAIKADEVTRSFNLRVGDLADTLNRVDVAGLNTSLSELAIQVGADDEGLRLALANFVALGKESGRSRAEIGNMGQELSALAAYLSVTNPALGTADEILARLPGSLARGGRGLTQYGIALTSTQIQTEALAQNTGKTAAELTVFDRAAAGLKLTMDQLGPSLAGGIAEGSESAAVKLRSLRVELKETIEAAGEPLIEPVTKSLEALQPVLVSVTQLIGEVAAAFAGVLAPALVLVADVATPVVKVLSDIPEPVVKVAAAAAIAYKGFGLLSTGLTALTTATAAHAAAQTAEATATAAQGAAAAAAAAATTARLAAEAELAAATLALSVADGELIGLQVDLAVAESEVVVATQAEALAMEELAAATEAAGAAGKTAATGFAATAAGFVASAAIIGAALANLHYAKAPEAKPGSAPAILAAPPQDVLKTFRRETLGDRDFIMSDKDVLKLRDARREFKDLAEESSAAGQAVVDAMAAAGLETSKYQEIVDKAKESEDASAVAKAANTKETKEAIEALSSGDPVAAQAAASTLKQSLAYEGLSQATKDAIDQQLAMKAASDGVTAAAAESAAQVQAQADAASNAATEFDAATSSLGAYLGLASDQAGQGLKFAIVLDDLKKKQDDLTKSKGKTAAAYVLETAEGRKNIDSLVGIVEAQQKVAVENIKNAANKGEIDKATAKYREQVEAIKAVAKQTGATDEQLDALLKHYGLFPDQLETAISITKVDEAKAKLDGFKSDVEKVPIDVRITTTINASEEFQKIVRALVAQGPIPLTTKVGDRDPGAVAGDIGSRLATGGVLDASGAPEPPRKPVSVASYAAGGISQIERYAQGEQHNAFVGTGVTRIFDEPETGGEAYIPLSPAKRKRSTDILEDVAGRFGYELVQVGARSYAEGAVVAGPTQEWGGEQMVRALVRVVDAVEALPAKLPRGGDTFNIDATTEQRDTFRELAESIVFANRRR